MGELADVAVAGGAHHAHGLGVERLARLLQVLALLFEANGSGGAAGAQPIDGPGRVRAEFEQAAHDVAQGGVVELNLFEQEIALGDAQRQRSSEGRTASRKVCSRASGPSPSRFSSTSRRRRRARGRICRPSSARTEERSHSAARFRDGPRGHQGAMVALLGGGEASTHNRPSQFGASSAARQGVLQRLVEAIHEESGAKRRAPARTVPEGATQWRESEGGESTHFLRQDRGWSEDGHFQRRQGRVGAATGTGGAPLFRLASVSASSLGAASGIALTSKREMPALLVSRLVQRRHGRRRRGTAASRRG